MSERFGMSTVALLKTEIKYTIWTKVYYYTLKNFNGMPLKSICINMDLVPPLQLQQLSLFWEGFSQDCGVSVEFYAQTYTRVFVKVVATAKGEPSQ